MTLAEQLNADYLAAYKSKDTLRLSVLRLVKTALTNRLVERMQQPLEEGDIVEILTKQCKQRNDSIEQYLAANRPDLAEKEKEELVVLKGYLPEQITGEALKNLIARLIGETGASGVKDMGKVMQALTARHKGRYDGKEASSLARDALAQA
ncbi:aspartyl-tRNA amidotransferase subunit B [Deltaproteobacteria bacterium]|nr:aspartyl-tRNA amidotransferase subunit B [Deltaproteobacteria bacterium]